MDLVKETLVHLTEEQIVFNMKNKAQNDLNDKFKAIQEVEKRLDENNKVQILTEDEVLTLQEYLLDIQIIGAYNSDDTPLDMFDTDCHDQEGGVI